MAQDYAGQPVVFIEYDVDDGVRFGTRTARWWAAFDAGSAYLPLTMVDSGEQISNGPVDRSVYQGMVDSAMARPPQAEIVAQSSRSGDKVRFDIELTNLSGVTLSSSNGATIWAIVYEDAHIANTDRYARAAVSTGISNLASGDATTFTLETQDLSDVNWDNLHYVALAEYRPGGTSGPWDMLQAAYAPSGAAFSVEPKEVTFVVDPADTSRPTAEVSIDAPAVVDWTATANAAWLTVTPTVGTSAIQPVISVVTAALSSGWQQGIVSFTVDSSFTDGVLVRAFYGSATRVYLPTMARRE